VRGKSSVGGLVGYNNKSKIINSYSSGVAIGESAIGGLAGDNNEGEISNSYSIGSVTAEDWGAGGLVGQNSKGKISKSYSTSVVIGGEDVIGGLAGCNGGEISNSYSTGTVKGKMSVGGLVGQNHTYGNSERDISAGTIINSYSTSEVIGGIRLANGFVKISNVGKLVGNNEGDKVINSYYEAGGNIEAMDPSYYNSPYYKGDGKTTAQMKQRTTFKNWDFDKIWGIKNTINSGYPYLLENKLANR